jgi:prolyl-tRNA synthetase
VPPVVDARDAPAAHVEDTPDTPTIDTLVALANERPELRRDDRDWTASDTLKNVIVKVVPPGAKPEPLAIGVPGDREVDLKRLGAQLHPSLVEPFTEEDFASHPGLIRGYIGPGVLGADKHAGVRYLLDPRVVDGTRWITGADEPGRHVFDLVAGRDFTGDGTIESTDVRESDPCPRCGSPLTLARGIEMGHIFQLGRRFADALGLQVLDENGRLVTVTMGSYGVGVSRAVAAVIENSHDEAGMIWPREIAPADVHLVATGKDPEVLAEADRITAELEGHGLSVLLDDRAKMSPGVKFKDAELIGIPTIVVVGKGLAEGVVEVKDRRSGQREQVPVADVVAHVTEVVRG